MKKTYEDRWTDIALELVKTRGQAGTIGYLIGVLSSQSKRDYDLKSILDELELNLNCSKEKIL